MKEDLKMIKQMDDKANGKGTYYYEDGVKYEGYFKDGKVVY